MGEGVMVVTKQEQYRHQVVVDFLSGRLKRRDAARLLGIRQRSVSRLAARVRKKGLAGIKHGNYGRAPVNRIPRELKRDVMALVRREYFDFNLTHCLERLWSDHGIELRRETFRKWCHAEGLVKRRQKRRSHARIYRERMPQAGLLLQLDGSPHRWNGTDVWTLIAAIDDATSDIPWAEFFPSEDTPGCMTVLWRVIERYGIPECLYVDKAGIFGGMKRQNFCQFARACDELGVRILFASSPQAKGRIERAFQTLQDRLVPEMRIRHIRRMARANEFLQTEFVPNFWRQRLMVPAREPGSRYRKLPDEMDLKEILCLKQWRALASDQTLSLDGKRWLLDLPLRYSVKGQRVEVRDYLDGSRRCFFAGNPVELLPLPISKSA